MHNACGRKAVKAAPTAHQALEEADGLIGVSMIDPDWREVLREEQLRATARSQSAALAVLYADIDLLRAALAARLPEGPGENIVYVRSGCTVSESIARGRRHPGAELIEIERPESEARSRGLPDFYRRQAHPACIVLVPIERRQYEGFRSFLGSLQIRTHLGFLFAPGEGWHPDRRDYE